MLCTGKSKWGYVICLFTPSLTSSQHPLHSFPGESPFVGTFDLLKPGSLLHKYLYQLPYSILCRAVLSLFPPSTCSSKGTTVLLVRSVCCYGNLCHKWRLHSKALVLKPDIYICLWLWRDLGLITECSGTCSCFPGPPKVVLAWETQGGGGTLYRYPGEAPSCALCLLHWPAGIWITNHSNSINASSSRHTWAFLCSAVLQSSNISSWESEVKEKYWKRLRRGDSVELKHAVGACSLLNVRERD